MSDRVRICAAATVGALVGGVVGYFYMTERGRATRQRLEPALAVLVGEVRQLRTLVDSVRTAAQEGLRALREPDADRADREGAWSGSVPRP